MKLLNNSFLPSYLHNISLFRWGVSLATVSIELAEVRPSVIGIHIRWQWEAGLHAIEQTLDEDIVCLFLPTIEDQLDV